MFLFTQVKQIGQKWLLEYVHFQKGEKYQLKKLHVETTCAYENAQNKNIFVTLVWFYLCFYMDISVEKG